MADADFAFAPLVLPVSSVTEGLENSYKVIATNGEAVTVAASSAAEAIEKSGVKRALRVISIRQEKQHMMERNLLHPQERTVPTNIDTENFVPDFRSLVVDNLEEEERAPFEECSLASIAVRSVDKLPEKPKPQPQPKPQPKPAEVAVVLKESKEEKEVIEIALPKSAPLPEPEIIPPDRELTPDEVEALMNAKELPGGE